MDKLTLRQFIIDHCVAPFNGPVREFDQWPSALGSLRVESKYVEVVRPTPRRSAASVHGAHPNCMMEFKSELAAHTFASMISQVYWVPIYGLEPASAATG